MCYFCTNSTHHATHKNSVPGCVFCKSTKYFGIQDNAVARPLNDAHLATLFFAQKLLVK